MERMPNDMYEDLLERWFTAQATLTPILKSLIETFQGEDHALLVLSRNEEGLTPTELMSLMGITPGRTSNLLKQLERKGLVIRTRDIANMRSVLVRATPAGTQRAKDAYAHVKNNLRARFVALGYDDTVELVRIAEKLADSEKGEKNR